MSKIYVIHENSEWLPPFAEAFDVEGVAWDEWYPVSYTHLRAHET